MIPLYLLWNISFSLTTCTYLHKTCIQSSLQAYSLTVTHTFALPPGFYPEKGLEEKPKLIPVKNSRRGEPITKITHAAATKDTFAQLVF